MPRFAGFPVLIGRSSRAARRGFVVLLAVGCLLGLAEARGQGFDKATRDRVKDATVYIKIKVNGKIRSAGSGFAINSKGDTVLVLTNRHVAVHEEEADDNNKPAGPKPEIFVVFRSATLQEQELPAKLLTFDHRSVPDLAMLEVKGVRQPPQPIAADRPIAESELFETMRTYSLGFPLGGLLGGGKLDSNPAITVSELVISSFRNLESGRLERIQLNGNMIQGNSGGPIVNDKGVLVGVVVERLANEPLGRAIPPNVITSFLGGDVDVPFGRLLAWSGNTAQLQIGGRMVDPLGKIRSMSLRYAPQSAVPNPLKSDVQGHYPLLPGSKVLPMRLVAASEIKNMPIADAAGLVEFDIPAPTAADRKIVIQIVVTDTFGRNFGGETYFVVLPDKAGPLKGMEWRAPDTKSLAQWSCQANLADRVKMKHEPGKTTISLPAGVALNHSPQNKLFNAPCALVRVDGDFDASVEVENTFNPGGEGAILPGGRKSLISFQSAGLLIWQDEKNFVRLERAKGSDGNISMLHQLLIEIYRSGKPPVMAFIPVPEQRIVVAAIRRGGSLKLLWATPPDQQLTTTQELAVDFDKEVFVGVAAANMSKNGFDAKLTNFNLKTPDGGDIVAKPYNMKWTLDTGIEKLADGTLVFEGATLGVRPPDAPVIKQDMAQIKEGVWSGDKQLLWNIDKGKKALSLELPVEATGKYEIKAIFTMAPDYGKVKLDLGSDKPLYKGGVLDLYSPEVKPSELMSLGVYSLSKGKVRLNITNFDRNQKSSGYHFGIDEIRLVPAK